MSKCLKILSPFKKQKDDKREEKYYDVPITALL